MLLLLSLVAHKRRFIRRAIRVKDKGELVINVSIQQPFLVAETSELCGEMNDREANIFNNLRTIMRTADRRPECLHTGKSGENLCVNKNEFHIVQMAYAPHVVVAFELGAH